MALSKVASVKLLGALVCFSKKLGSCDPLSPLMKEGKTPASFFVDSGDLKTTRQPSLIISLPVVLKLTSAAFPITVVFETSHSS